MELKYSKVLLKLSGMAVANDQKDFDFSKVETLVKEIKELQDKGLQLAIVIGGGNIMRGRSIKAGEIEVDRADYMGMLATNINSLALGGIMDKLGVANQVLSAWPMKGLVPEANKRNIKKCLKQNKVIVFGGGTGKPGRSTDTTSTLRAQQAGMQVILKATDVDGVYDSDPNENADAKMFDSLTYTEAIDKKLKVMDELAFNMAKDDDMKIIVFKMEPGNLTKVVSGEKLGTTVSN
ncbi:MAG: UMP kinase [Candidatus Komeilibacteria bacterium]